MIHGAITVVSYVDGVGPWLRCACAECSAPWRAHVLLTVAPPWSLSPDEHVELERAALRAVAVSAPEPAQSPEAVA